MQVSETVFGAMFDGLPHEQIVWAQLLKLQIRRAEFIQGAPSLVKKHSSGKRPLSQSRQGYKTATRPDHVAMDVFKKTKRLRRDSMMSPCPAMQFVITFDGFKSGAEFDPQTMLLGFANSAAHGRFQPFEQLFFANSKVNQVAKKGE